MREVVKVVLSDRLDGDYRPLVATFQVPGLEGTFGVYPPNMNVHGQLLAVSDGKLTYTLAFLALEM